MGERPRFLLPLLSLSLLPRQSTTTMDVVLAVVLLVLSLLLLLASVLLLLLWLSLTMAVRVE